MMFVHEWVPAFSGARRGKGLEKWGVHNQPRDSSCYLLSYIVLSPVPSFASICPRIHSIRSSSLSPIRSIYSPPHELTCFAPAS